MKILIDGCVFTEDNPTEVIEFWQKAIPPLITQLQGHNIYFLNRASNPTFPEVEFKNLFAPKVDFDNFHMEACRLMALCKELEIDLFISTYNTSAGTGAKSLFVLGESMPQINILDNDAVLSSRESAIKMAAGYLLFNPEAAEILDKMGIVKDDRIWLAYSGSTTSQMEVDWKAFASQFAIAIQELFNYELKSEAIGQLKAEEEAVKAKNQHLKLLGEEEAKTKAVYPEYKPQKSQKLAIYLMPFLRIYRALKNPQRYPEYRARIYQWMKRKIKPHSSL